MDNMIGRPYSSRRRRGRDPPGVNFAANPNRQPNANRQPDANFAANANRQPNALSPAKYLYRQSHPPNYAQHSEEHNGGRRNVHVPNSYNGGRRNVHVPNSDYHNGNHTANQVHAVHENHVPKPTAPSIVSPPSKTNLRVRAPLQRVTEYAPSPSMSLSEINGQNWSLPQLADRAHNISNQSKMSNQSRLSTLSKLSSLSKTTVASEISVATALTAASIHSHSQSRSRSRSHSHHSSQESRDYRRVFGYFFCERCQLQWESPDTFETTNQWYVDAQECPGCRFPIVPFETAKLCVFCDAFPCLCCGQCECFPCKCCVRCIRSPCQCCRRCGRDECAPECCDDCNRCPCRCLCRSCGRFQPDCSCEVRVYGFYRCSKCGKTWESAYTFIRGGGKTGQKAKFAKVIYGQQCKGCSCEDFFVARKWERIVCQNCLVKPCACKDKRHIDHDKNHMQALCERCKNKANPCSSFRFVASEHCGKEEQAEEVRVAEERAQGVLQRGQMSNLSLSHPLVPLPMSAVAWNLCIPVPPLLQLQ